MVQTISAESSGENDSPEFPSLARQYYEPVYRFLRRQLPTEADAADLTQETFLRAQQSFSRFDDSRDFAPWIYTIARRCAADFYRKRKQATELLEDRFTDPEPDPHARVAAGEDSAALWEMAAQLKPKQHQVLLLHYREQFSIAETAIIMGLSQTHVKVLLFRARTALKRLLPEERFNGGNS